MPGKLLALIPPPTSLWSLMGVQTIKRPLPLVGVEEDCILSWKLGVREEALTVTINLHKEDDDKILKSLELPAHPVFSTFHRAFENISGERTAMPKISPIFESLNIPDPQTNDVNEFMAAQNGFVKDELSKWIKPGKGLDRLTGNLFTCVSADVSMAINMGLTAFRPN